MFNLMDKKILTILCHIFCLSGGNNSAGNVILSRHHTLEVLWWHQINVKDRKIHASVSSIGIYQLPVSH